MIYSQNVKGNVNVCLCVYVSLRAVVGWRGNLLTLGSGIWRHCLAGVWQERISCQQVVYLVPCVCVGGETSTWPLLMIPYTQGTWPPFVPASDAIGPNGWCTVSCNDSVWTVCLYCNFLCVRIAFSLFSYGLDGKHMDRHVVLLSRRKINQEERPPSSLCTPPWALRYQEKFRPVTQHRQGSSMHTNTFMSPPPAPATHAPGLVLWGRRWGIDGSLSYVIREAGTERGWPIHNRNMHSGSHSSYFRLQLGHSFDWHIWPSLSVYFFFNIFFSIPSW